MGATRIFDQDDGGSDEGLFAAIAEGILQKDYSIIPNALSPVLLGQLYEHLQSMSAEQFVRAGTGRRSDYGLNDFVRTDSICWITGQSAAGRQWLEWSEKLRRFLNQRLLLGLFSFESYFSHYGPGDFYRKHCDAFKGETNRVLSLVLYLNPGWTLHDGGELVLYSAKNLDQPLVKVTPGYGTLVTFLSEGLPHEVLPAKRDRYSIAGWFRVNTSISIRVDPPL